MKKTYDILGILATVFAIGAGLCEAVSKFPELQERVNSLKTDTCSVETEDGESN